MKKIILLSISALAIILMASACQKEEVYGYLQVGLDTIESAFEAKSVTSVPGGYNARRLYVEILDASGVIVKSTNDYANDATFAGTIKLLPGKYTVNAHSYGWDGSDSGFDAPYYTGSASATVTAKELRSVNVVCTLANVKVTVNYDDSFKKYFKMATTNVESLADEYISPRDFAMGGASKVAYFPEGDLALTLYVINFKNEYHAQLDTVRNVSAREHIKIVYKIAAAGTMGGVTVSVDDQTRTYSFDIPIPRKPGISFECYDPKPWSNFADLKAEITGKTASFEVGKMDLQWKAASATSWNTISHSSLTKVNDDLYTYRLKGLTPSTKYQYRVHYAADDPVDSEPYTFTTGTEEALYNGGFEYWYTDGKIQYPDQSGVKYWNTSNPGSADYIGSVTVKETAKAHSGSSCAKLQTQYAVIKLAAGSLYTGDFKGLITTKGAKLDWGVPFTSRPTSLKGYFIYEAGSINRGSQPGGAPDKGSNDHCSIFCALLTEQLHVGGNASSGEYENSTVINWQTDSRVIAYGELERNVSTAGGQWEAFEIPLEYHKTTAIPSYMLIVCSSSKWGDFFYGSDESVLYLDDFEFVYGDNPTVK